MKLRSPAKVNLFLKILKKRPDGFHELETVFERVDLCDTVYLRPDPKGAICVRTNLPDLAGGPSNLAFRAAELLKKYSGVSCGVRIDIRKRIPVAAGLGGGSSNAATVLLGLNRLWKLNLSRGELLKLAARIGSDVPFFILRTPFALGRGRGEKLKILPAGAGFWHVIVKPSFSISTKQAYADYDRGLPLTPPKADVRMLARFLKKNDGESLANGLFNSLELVLNKRLMSILKIKENLLNQGARGALMSGSGSAVFGIFESKRLAGRAAKNLRRRFKNYRVFLASTYLPCGVMVAHRPLEA